MNVREKFLLISTVLILGVTFQVKANPSPRPQIPDTATIVRLPDSLSFGSLPRMDYSKPAKPYTIGKLEALGLTMIDPTLLVNTTGLQVGDTIIIPGDMLSSAMRRLWEQRHYSNVQVATQYRGDTVDITFLLNERLRVREWGFAGTKGNDAKELKEKLKLRRASELSPYVLSTAMNQIRDYYYEKGFRNVKIETKVDKDTAELLKNFRTVTFFITKGKRVRIGEIAIEGNANIAAKKLVKSFEKTKKVSINFFADTKFNQANFDADKEKLTAYYRSKGYRDARIVADSLYKVVDKKGVVKDNRIGIWIKVDEGKKYYYRDITWIGNSKIPTDYLQLMMGLKHGDTYDSETMGIRLGTIQSAKQGEQSVAGLYRDDGYLAFGIEPVERVIGDSVDVEIRMIEGKQFRINNVDFEGNTRTNDHVIRREMDTRPGELYSQSLLIRTYQRLATMGQFDAESFAVPSIIPNMQAETVDIKYSLKEVSNDQFELSGGWGGGMFIASVGVNFTNISLRKFFDPKAWRPYPAGDAQTVNIKFQSNGTYYVAGSVGFTEPWLGGRKPTSLSVNFFTSRETNAWGWGMKPTKYFGTIGGSVSIGKRVTWPDPYFTLSAGLSWQTYNLHDWDYFLVKNGSSNLFALNIAFGRSSVDDPVGYSTRGSDISLSLSITPPYSSFDGKNYGDPKMPNTERYLWIEYHKWKFNARWFFPLSPDNKLVLMARVQFGYLGSFNSNKPSPFEGFQMGGDGLTGYNIYGVETIGLRGYENNSLTPRSDYGEYASIYSKYILELRYPVVKTGGTLVYALVFAEAGNAFMKLNEFKPFNLKRSAGVGLRVYLPVLGMLGVDWGYGFDAVPNKPGKPSGSQFHFTMGMQM